MYSAEHFLKPQPAFRPVSLLLAGMLFLGAAAFSPRVLYAGDSAAFVDLGFSPDGNFYMFGQYGVMSGELKSWADLFVVDVAHNTFVRGGRLSYTHNKSIDAGQNGSGALYGLIAKNAALAEKYKVSYPSQGQPLYIALEGDPAYDGEAISFRDFVSSTAYRACITEAINGAGKDLSSSFYISLECTDIDGSEKTYAIGDIEVKRPLVSSYRIKKVLISPPGNALVFVIEMKRQADVSHDIRYMVETIQF